MYVPQWGSQGITIPSRQPVRGTMDLMPNSFSLGNYLAMYILNPRSMVTLELG